MNEIYVSIDGDSIGKIIERYILITALDDLKQFSQMLQDDILLISEQLKANGGTVHMQGGDNILASLDKNAVNPIIAFIEKINQNRQYHFSVGLGNSPVDSYLSLKYAKLTKISPIIYFSDSKFSVYSE